MTIAAPPWPNPSARLEIGHPALETRHVAPTRVIELQQHITDLPDIMSEETSILLDHSSAEWALYCLLTGHETRAHEHLHRIRPATKPAVLQAARDLVAILQAELGEQPE